MTATAATRPTTVNAKRAGALAPLVREAWYVVAARAEFDRTLKQRWILGEPVCFYEATDGTPVVLDDRCAHRRFPLSRSRLDGDVIQCGYHGFRYGKDGLCVAVPGGSTPRSIRVRAYPAVQRGPFVWIWTGADPAAANPDLIPWPDHDLDGGDFVTGYALNPANYGMVHENLLDLTHLQYLHGIDDPAFTETAPALLAADDLPPKFANQSVGYRKDIETTLGVHAANAAADPALPINKYCYYASVTPALNYGIERVEPHDPDATRLRALAVLHCITPADESATHQFWAYWQDVPLAIEPAQLSSFVDHVFNQDIEALGWQQEYVESDTRKDVVEGSVPADQPTLRVRRMLHQLAAAER